MCYAIPGRVEKVEGKTVIVDYFGQKRRACNELVSVSIGDYIYAQGGFVINKIPVAEAESILSVWKETFFDLQELDLKISRLNLKSKGVDNKLGGILDRAVTGEALKKEELLYLLDLKSKPALDLFFKAANFLRQKNNGNSCCVHGIIEISNVCKNSCCYCGISRHNKSLKRFRMDKNGILKAAQEAIENYGFKSLVLQSGEGSGYSIYELADVIREIKNNWPCLIFISFGEVGLDNLEVLYRAGARGMLMRFESSNPKIYRDIHPGQTLASRLAHLKKAYEIGYLILTGALIGIPGQTQEDILNDIYLAGELHAEMFSFGPFLKHPNTPFKGKKQPKEEDVLKVLALARLMGKENAKILVTTALETLSPESRKKGMLAGANSIMLNVTPLQYRQLYSIYPNRAHAQESIDSQIQDTLALLRSLGRAPTDLSI